MRKFTECPNCGESYTIAEDTAGVIEFSATARPEMMTNDDGSIGLSIYNRVNRSIYIKIKCKCLCLFEHSESNY